MARPRKTGGRRPPRKPFAQIPVGEGGRPRSGRIVLPKKGPPRTPPKPPFAQIPVGEGGRPPGGQLGPNEPGTPGVPTPPGTPPGPVPSPWESDPILAQVRTAYTQALASSEAQAFARRQQLLTQYGDPNLARSILGQDSPYAQAAEQNPFSTLANLRYGYQQGQGELNENLNKANLFYSSTRGDELGKQAHAYQGQLYGAAQEAQGGLSSIAENLLGDRTGAEDMLRGAQEDAYERWLARSLQDGGLPEMAAAPGTPAAPGAPNSAALAAAQRRFQQLRSSGRVRAGVGYDQYAANHPAFRTRYGL